MRKILMIFILICLVSTASAEEMTGTWSGKTKENGIRVLTLEEDGTGSLTENGEKQAVTWDEAYDLYADGEKIASLTLEEGFLIFHDMDFDVWPMMRNEADLPERIQARSEEEFYGSWKADYALVSGFRIPMDEVEISYLIDDGSAVCSGTGYAEPVRLPVALEDGSLRIENTQTDMTVVLSLREDGTMTRDMTYMTIHYSR